MPHLAKAKAWLPTSQETESLFDGQWKASIGTRNVTAVISRRKVYADTEFVADIKLVTERIVINIRWAL